jgi:hypothetical protein
MADIQLLSVDAVRYSSRHKTWRESMYIESLIYLQIFVFQFRSHV